MITNISYLFIICALGKYLFSFHFGVQTILHITFCKCFAELLDFWSALQGLFWRGEYFFMLPDWTTAVSSSASWNCGQESGAYPFLTNALHPQRTPSNNWASTTLRMGSRTLDLPHSFVYYSLKAPKWWILSLFLYLFCFWDFQREETNLNSKVFFPNRMQKKIEN